MDGATHVTSVDWLWLIPFMPLLGAAVLGLTGASLQRAYGKKAVSVVACGSMAVSSAVTLGYFFFALLPAPADQRYLYTNFFPMLAIGKLHAEMAFAMDPLGGTMACVVTVIGTAIHVYSTAYMHEEPSTWRYFCYLNLFCFSMLLLVLGDNFLVMFFGWEGVGLCSYLLIGFWYTDLEKAKAGMKAFVVNRVGDWGFLCGLLVLFWGLAGIWGQVGATPSLTFRDLHDQIAQIGGGALAQALTEPIWLGGGIAFWACIGFFLGACGKSAQIPLYVWLPDAMAGPTPVSALIHAATMVTAGVYMVARLNFLFAISPGASTVVACVGAATALFAATIGFFQHDIKKVLAYSTVSQLGYMFIGVGVGAYWAGIYHLFTHAFFKACLFLGSGSVIHAMHWVHHRHGQGHGHGHAPDPRDAPDPADPQDMRNMGGLAKLMPSTRWTYLLACIAIAGLPVMSGYYSKDAILYAAFNARHLLVPGKLIWAAGLLGAGCTAFYMFRSYFMTFHGRAPTREHLEHVHESPRAMTFVLWFLAGGAFFALFLGLPPHPVFAHFLHHVAPTVAEHHSLALELALGLVSVSAAGAGIWLAYALYFDGARSQERLAALRVRFDAIHRVVYAKYFVDEGYQAAVIDPTVDVSRDLARFDLSVIDWAVNFVGAVSRFVSRIGGWLDFWIVDGLVNLLADRTLSAGQRVRRAQTGRINNYAYVAVAGAVVLLLVTYMGSKQ
ncbi:MAG: NADH-quinone oxidoreductase subunit L [Myxococcota bacterium]